MAGIGLSSSKNEGDSRGLGIKHLQVTFKENITALTTNKGQTSTVSRQVPWDAARSKLLIMAAKISVDEMLSSLTELFGFQSDTFPLKFTS